MKRLAQRTVDGKVTHSLSYDDAPNYEAAVRAYFAQLDKEHGETSTIEIRDDEPAEVYAIRRREYVSADDWVEALFDHFSERSDSTKLNACIAMTWDVKTRYPLPTPDDVADEVTWWAKVKGWFGG